VRVGQDGAVRERGWGVIEGCWGVEGRLITRMEESKANLSESVDQAIKDETINFS
jgi:hypothetical protein